MSETGAFVVLRAGGQGGQAVRFGPSGGLIGRGAHCALVLDDPERITSKEHARLSFEQGVFYITVLGRNGLQLGGQTLPPDPAARQSLKLKDHLRIGRQDIVVEEISAVLPASGAPNPPAAQDHPPVSAPPLPPLSPPARPGASVDQASSTPWTAGRDALSDEWEARLGGLLTPGGGAPGGALPAAPPASSATPLPQQGGVSAGARPYDPAPPPPGPQSADLPPPIVVLGDRDPNQTRPLSGRSAEFDPVTDLGEDGPLMALLSGRPYQPPQTDFQAPTDPLIASAPPSAPPMAPMPAAPSEATAEPQFSRAQSSPPPSPPDIAPGDWPWAAAAAPASEPSRPAGAGGAIASAAYQAPYQPASPSLGERTAALPAWVEPASPSEAGIPPDAAFLRGIGIGLPQRDAAMPAATAYDLGRALSALCDYLVEVSHEGAQGPSSVFGELPTGGLALSELVAAADYRPGAIEHAVRQVIRRLRQQRGVARGSTRAVVVDPRVMDPARLMLRWKLDPRHRATPARAWALYEANFDALLDEAQDAARPDQPAGGGSR